MHSQDEPLVKVENVGKIFCRDLKRSLWYGVIDAAQDLFLSKSGRSSHPGQERNLRADEFWANQGISFELRKGQCLGLIGRNGGGKTTLLKMLNGLIKPDSGRIEMNGRVGALIALGAGFNPILTGRENVFIAGSVLGLTKKEVEKRYDEIVEFSELDAFMETPVQNYSSGMRVRLGFSVASTLDPDILLLDEVLAVGDMGFVIKSLNRIRGLMQNCAVILVSHRMQFISQFCTDVLFLKGGRTELFTDNVPEGVVAYLSDFPIARSEQGSGEAVIQRLELLDADFNDPWYAVHSTDCEYCYVLEFSVVEDLECFGNLTVKDIGGASLLVVDFFDEEGCERHFSKGNHCLEINLGPLGLTTGTYSVTATFRERQTRRILVRSENWCPLCVHLSDGARYAPFERKIQVKTLS